MSKPTQAKMLILRGISGHFDGKNWPRGALYEQPALDYARLRGYNGVVLDVSGEAYDNSPQVKAALEALTNDPLIIGLYGFSGGGYNIRHILNRADIQILDRLRLVVVIGAPKNSPDLYKGNWELVYRKDPPQGHMYGPFALLNELDEKNLPNPPG